MIDHSQRPDQRRPNLLIATSIVLLAVAFAFGVAAAYLMGYRMGFVDGFDNMAKRVQYEAGHEDEPMEIILD